MIDEGSATPPSVEIRDLIAGIIVSTIDDPDTDQVELAAGLIDAMYMKMFMAFGRHAESAGCERCGQLIHDLSAAKNASDSEAFDHAMNELYSHMSLEDDLVDMSWLE